MAVRAPHLHLTLRSFCLGAFVFLGRALEEGDDLPFAFEEHVQRGGPALYEYRPLVRTFVESRASALEGREDARIALDELLREPAAAIFARAHAGPRPSEEQALFRTVLLSLLISTAESCGGFDWDDTSFERAYAELEGSLFGAVARLRGRGAARRDLGRDAGRARCGDPHSRRRDRRARPSLARGAGPPPARLRSRGRPLLRARAGARARGRGGAARRARRARRRRLRDPPRHRRSRRRRARPVRAARLAAVRDPAGPADRGHAAAGRADAARLLPRRAGAASCSRAWRSPTPTRRSPRRSTAGSSRSSSTSRSVPSSSAEPSPACSATRGSCAPPCSSATRARSGGRSTPRCGRSLRASEPASQRAEDAVRRSLVETLRHGDRAGARALARRRRCSGCGTRRGWPRPPSRANRHTFVTEP